MSAIQHHHHLDRRQIDLILSHAMWLPRGRGFTDRFMQRDHPTWVFDDLLDTIVAAGLGDRHRANAGGERAPEGVVALDFDCPHRWTVTWNGGRATSSGVWRGDRVMPVR